MIMLAKSEDGQLFAMKIYDQNDPHALNSFKIERDAYLQLNHPNLVRMFAHEEDALWTKADGSS